MSMGSCKTHSHHSRVEAEIKGGVLVSELPLSLLRLEPCLLWRRVRQNRLPKHCARLFVLPACCYCLLLPPAVGSSSSFSAPCCPSFHFPQHLHPDDSFITSSNRHPPSHEEVALFL